MVSFQEHTHVDFNTAVLGNSKVRLRILFVPITVIRRLSSGRLTHFCPFTATTGSQERIELGRQHPWRLTTDAVCQTTTSPLYHLLYEAWIHHQTMLTAPSDLIVASAFDCAP